MLIRFALIGLLALTACSEQKSSDDIGDGKPDKVTQACDAVAAHPEDPNKPDNVKGVSDEDLDAVTAIDACLEAVEAHPDEPRLQFQFARALMNAPEDVNKEIEADDLAYDYLNLAAKANYLPAYAYLADFETDDAQAIALLQKSADGGFQPAARLIAQIAENKEANIGQGRSNPNVSRLSANEREAGNDLFTEGYHASRLMEYIYGGQFDKIPDDRETRALVVSVLTSFNKFCGESDVSISAAAIKYGSEEMRQLQRDPVNALGKMLQDIVTMRDSALATGDVMGSAAEYAKKRSILKTEGLEDGQRFATINGCSGDVFYQFRDNLSRLISQRASYNPAPYDELKVTALLSEEYRRRHNISDPSKELRARTLKSFAEQTQKGCMNQYEDSSFCTCLTEKLGETDLDDEDRSMLARDFKAFPTIAKEKPVLLSTVRSCRGG